MYVFLFLSENEMSCENTTKRRNTRLQFIDWRMYDLVPNWLRKIISQFCERALAFSVKMDTV